MASSRFIFGEGIDNNPTLGYWWGMKKLLPLFTCLWLASYAHAQTTNIAPVTPQLTEAQKADIQYQIKVLQWDIEEKNRLMHKERVGGTTGAYPEIIRQDKAQIEILKARLTAPIGR